MKSPNSAVTAPISDLTGSSIPGDQSINSQMAKGAAWMMLFKIIDRGTGIFSTLILARLLLPEDFGLISLATSVIVMLEVLGAFGLDIALVQRVDATREHFDTVWTFHLIVAVCLGLIVAALAWPTARFYDDPRLATVMFVLALRHIIQGLENVGIIAFRKELRFDQEFRFLLIKRLATTLIVTIPLAFILGNYWALLAGNFAGTCFAVALSYVVHPFRPRLSLARLGQLMTFSKWLFITSVVEFFYGRVANLIVGRWSGPAALGMLSMAGEISGMVSRELAAPVNRAVFPGYAQLKSDPSLLRRCYLKVTSVLILLIMPAGVGLCLLAEPIVMIALGSKWAEAIPLLRILAVNGVLTVFLSTAHHVNLAVGMSRSTSLVLAAHACLTIPLMLWLVPRSGAYGAATSMLIASILTTPLNFSLLSQAIEFGRREVYTILYRPTCATIVMVGAIVTTQYYWRTPSTFLERAVYLVSLSALGVSVYSATAWLLWRVKNDSDSAEAWVIEKGRAALAKIVTLFRSRSQNA
jgi:lipopolysaccharide exporter